MVRAGKNTSKDIELIKKGMDSRDLAQILSKNGFSIGDHKKGYVLYSSPVTDHKVRVTTGKGATVDVGSSNDAVSALSDLVYFQKYGECYAAAFAAARSL